ncbi:polyprenyl synthetase family protein [Streptococcus sp. S784/96/1]|uniref:polyprenyl synthetase family protein n=1 Tax=Streptococcus sp. S784/96/1 TaxID=2653499 RepID=UPI00138A27D6|nr:polyprenyl synthetase family protein [Streptococcus sp. S784/96/1]
MVHRIWDSYPTIQENLEQVKQIMMSELRVNHPDIKAKILEYIDAPGKYVRAGLSLLLAMEEDGHIPEGKLYLAAYVEMLHLATLIHDDVIDVADSRRGIEVINKTFSNRVAIYAGDYLLAYANRLALKGTDLLKVSSDDTQVFNPYLVERVLTGELAQLMNQYSSQMTMKAYLKQIQGKTAFLFALACQLGAWRKHISRKESKLAFQIGQNIGMAFQISDDLIDYRVSQSHSGKPRMQDVQNGIYTAPYLLAQASSEKFRKYIATIDLRYLSEDNLLKIHELLEEVEAFTKTEDLVDKFMSKAFICIDKKIIPDTKKLKIFLEQLMNRQF